MRTARLAMALTAVVVFAPAAWAYTWTWTGGDADDANWSSPDNWTPSDPTYPIPTSGLGNNNGVYFAGTTRTTTNNDIVDLFIRTINFTNTADGQSFTLNGNAVTLGNALGGGVNSTTPVADASITDTINLDLILPTSNKAMTATMGNGKPHNVILNGDITVAIKDPPVTNVAFSTNGSPSTVTLNGLNTFNGTVNVGSAAVIVNTFADFGVASSLGASPAGYDITTSAGLKDTSITYTGDGDSSNRTFQIGGTNGGHNKLVGLLNDGTGALTFTAANFNTPIELASAPNTNARVLELGGSYTTSANEIQGVIANNEYDAGSGLEPTGLVALLKSGDGTWILSGESTYTGSTTVSGGTLGLTGSVLNTDDLIFSGGVLDLSTTGMIQVLQDNYDETDANNDITASNIIGTGLSVTTVDVGGADYTQISAVPEPATLALLALGGLAMVRRRRRLG